MFNIDAAKIAAGRKLGMALLKTRQYSPEILTVVGVVGVVAAVALTVRSTLHLEETLDKSAPEIEEVKARNIEGLYSEKEYKKALTKTYAKRVWQIGKLYAPPAITLTLGVGSLLCANGIMRKRNLAMVAAYRVLKSQYDTFNKNVQDELGEEKARDLRLGLTEERLVDFEEGNEIVLKKSDPSRHSPYARFFDEGNPNYNNHWREGNLMFLVGQQTYANNRLNARGWLTLNEVYEALGLPESPDGAVVGWVRDGNPAAKDGYVDFGIFDIDSPEARNFVNGFEKNILLDFNVDGLIFDHIGRD